MKKREKRFSRFRGYEFYGENFLIVYKSLFCEMETFYSEGGQASGKGNIKNWRNWFLRTSL